MVITLFSGFLIHPNIWICQTGDALKLSHKICENIPETIPSRIDTVQFINNQEIISHVFTKLGYTDIIYPFFHQWRRWVGIIDVGSINL